MTERIEQVAPKVLFSSKMADGFVKRNATYADIEALPEGKHGELIDGDLYVFGRPRVRHALAITRLHRELVPAEQGPKRKAWVILFEVEIWLGKLRKTLLVPDLAGWRRERMPEVPDVQTLELVPDWVCEGLSPSTLRHDKGRKREVYAKYGVKHVWYADPKHKTLEILELDGESYRLVQLAGGSDRGVFAPFAHEIDLSMLWRR